MQKQLADLYAILSGANTGAMSQIGLAGFVLLLAVSLASSLFAAFLYLHFYANRATGSQVHRAFPLLGLSITAIFIAIQFSLPLSLGLLGALSIVRFRTALKDPLDIVYMFWAIALGLTSGAGFFELAIIGCIVLAVIMVAVTAITQFGMKKPYLLVIRYSPSFRGEFQQLIPAFKVKSKTVTPQAVELVVELTLKNQDSRFLDRLQQLDGILSASLVRYSGDF